MHPVVFSGRRNGYRFITGTDSQLVGSVRVTVGSWEGLNVLRVGEYYKGTQNMGIVNIRGKVTCLSWGHEISWNSMPGYKRCNPL